MVHCNMRLYAYDSQIYCSFPYNDTRTAEDVVLNYDLNIIATISKPHSVMANPHKSRLFGNRQNSEEIQS